MRTFILTLTMLSLISCEKENNEEISKPKEPIAKDTIPKSPIDQDTIPKPPINKDTIPKEQPNIFKNTKWMYDTKETHWDTTNSNKIYDITIIHDSTIATNKVLFDKQFNNMMPYFQYTWNSKKYKIIQDTLIAENNNKFIIRNDSLIKIKIDNTIESISYKVEEFKEPR